MVCTPEWQRPKAYSGVYGALLLNPLQIPNAKCVASNYQSISKKIYTKSIAIDERLCGAHIVTSHNKKSHKTTTQRNSILSFIFRLFLPADAQKEYLFHFCFSNFLDILCVISDYELQPNINTQQSKLIALTMFVLSNKFKVDWE